MTEFSKQFVRSLQSKDSFGIFLVFLVALMVMIPVSMFGIPSGSDFPQHYQFAQIYHQSILTGDFLPNWSTHENHGFGGIGIRFYPPLANYVLALARILTGNWYEASCLTFFIWMFVGCLGIYIWAREWLSPMESAAAASLFALAPYHLTQIYQFFLYAEFAALAFLPFCFAFVTRVCQRRKPIDIICLAIFYALLILTHIPTTITGSISLGLFAIFVIDWQKFTETILKLSVSFALGLAATAFHWVKIVTEINWLNHLSPQFSSGDYDYRLSFFPIFISSADNYFAKVAYLKDLVSIAAAFFLILPLLTLLLLKFGKKNDDETNNKVFRAMVFVGLFAFFMSTLLSAFIWETFPLLQKIQFPFRWLSVVSAVGAISFIIAVKYLIHFSEKLKRAAVYFALLILLSVSLLDITQIILPAAPYTRNIFEEKTNNLLNEESFDCWWTIWARREAFNFREKVFAESRTVKINTWSGGSREFEVESGSQVDARIATFYYPYWKAEINGKPVTPQMFDDGTILVPVPNEKSNVKLFFREPALIKFSNFFSVSIWLFFLAGVLWLGFIKCGFKQNSICK